MSDDGSGKQWSYLTDMDGVLVHEEHLIPGADEFIAELKARDVNFVVRDEQPHLHPARPAGPAAGHRAGRAGGPDLDLGPGHGEVHGRAAAGRQRLRHRRSRPDHRAARGRLSYSPTAIPTTSYWGRPVRYSFEAITTAIRLVVAGARFVSTNPDATGPSRAGILPAVGAVAALIEKATGRSPYFIGKPNPLMMRSALRAIGAHSESTIMIGDRMDTDVIAGLEAGLATILVMSGISTPQTIEQYPFRPSLVIDSIADLVGRTGDPFGAR